LNVYNIYCKDLKLGGMKMATTTIKNTAFSFNNQKEYSEFMSRIDRKATTLNSNVRKTKHNLKAIKEIKIDGETYKV
ncbi:TPA: hypothetical protein ACN9PE_003056, partial [Listeria monocytogenes]